MNFYEFASGNPWLTFFLFFIVGEVIIKIVYAFTKKKENNDE